MRLFFWILVIVNVGLLAYFNLNYVLLNQPIIQQPEISPEKIQLLSAVQIAALPKKEISLAQTAPVKPETACYEWGVLSDLNLKNAQTALQKLSLQAQVNELASLQPKRFWIYSPPFKSSAIALQKAEEYKELGVSDLFVVQEVKWKNAISFGIFEDEQLATKLLQELQSQGVKEVAKTLRSQGRTHYSLLLKHLQERDVAELSLLKPDFPEANLKPIACN